MTVVWTRPALQDMRRLDRDAADRVREAVNRFAGSGQGDVRTLAGGGDEYRLRVGDYRVRFTYQERTTLVVLRVLHRREAYRGHGSGG